MLKLCYAVLIFNIHLHFTTPFFLDYFWTPNEKSDDSNNVIHKLTDQNVPYEIATIDEKFIAEAAKLTGLALSELDQCQHRVVLKLQTTCHKMNDEQLSKMAVMLLNCQSAAEGREIFPCTDTMTLRDCTSDMSPDVWNAYHLMTNRARAVCYSIQQAQFRGLTELTINKLMDTARNQINIMTQLSNGQSELEETMHTTMESITDGHEILKKQQKDLQQAQFYGQLAIEQNIHQLTQEKALIKAGHDQLIKMTEDVKSKLELASEQLEGQTDEHRNYHQKVLNDLLSIQKQARNIWQRIEESSNHILKQSTEASRQYETTLKQLREVNATIHVLVDLVTSSRTAIDSKLIWLSETLGGTGDTIDRVYFCVSNTVFLTAAMIVCAFLNAPIFTRYAVMALVPLNLIVALRYGTKQALEPSVLGAVLVGSTIVYIAINILMNYIKSKNIEQTSASWKAVSKQKQSDKNSELSQNIMNTNEDRYTDTSSFNLNHKSSDSFRNVTSSNIYDDVVEEEEDDDNFSSVSKNKSVPSFRNSYLSNFKHFSPISPLRSRSNTPSQLRNDSIRKSCVALTRTGSICKLSAIAGRDYCHKHQLGNSIIN